jgi:acyl carrier protein
VLSWQKQVEDNKKVRTDSRARSVITGLIKAGIVAEGDIDAETRLVSSGVVDSFELVRLLEIVEQVTRCRIPAGRVAPQDLDTVESMLRTADRWGQPVQTGREP